MYASAVAHNFQVTVTVRAGFSDDNPPRGCERYTKRNRRAGDHLWASLTRRPRQMATLVRLRHPDQERRERISSPLGKPLSCVGPSAQRPGDPGRSGGCRAARAGLALGGHSPRGSGLGPLVMGNSHGG